MSSKKEFPPYSYVTGKFPHPTHDERGHSFGAAVEPVELDDADDWRQCSAYLWGIELFNRGYYWEAHESWESVWLAAGRSGTTADFCKALIKLAAAGVKAREGRPGGIQRHAMRARELFGRVLARIGEERSTFMGLPVQGLLEHSAQLCNDADALVNTADAPVIVVMPFTLMIASE